MWRMVAAVSVLLLTSTMSVWAQPDLGIDTRVSPDERLRLEARPPAHDVLRPSDVGDWQRGSSVTHDPLFLGPTIRSGGSELGLSAWIAPNTPVGGAQAGWREVNGWASLGLTFRWGGPPNRPSPGSAIR